MWTRSNVSVADRARGVWARSKGALNGGRVREGAAIAASTASTVSKIGSREEIPRQRKASSQAITKKQPPRAIKLATTNDPPPTRTTAAMKNPSEARSTQLAQPHLEDPKVLQRHGSENAVHVFPVELRAHLQPLETDVQERLGLRLLERRQ